MPEFKTLTPSNLDQMVLDLFQDWGHVDWFWRNASDGRTQDTLLKSNITRSTQIARANHREEPILNWISPESPRVLFVASMVFCSPDDAVRQMQAPGLYSAIREHWEPNALNQVFAWMHADNFDNWIRCRNVVKKENGDLKKDTFALFDNLSEDFRNRLSLCSGLGIVPTAQMLQGSGSRLDETIDGIGLLL